MHYLFIIVIFLLLIGDRSELENGSTITTTTKMNLKNPSDVNATWKEFKQEWQNCETASGINKHEEQIRVATFLHVAGKVAHERYNK